MGGKAAVTAKFIDFSSVFRYKPIMSFGQIFIITGLLLVILELVLGFFTGFDLLIIGTILIIGGFSGNLFNSSYLTLGISILLGITYLWLGRNFIKKKITIATKHTNIDKLIDSTGIVLQSISPNKAGLVKIEDEQWRATSDQKISTKQKIQVISIQGVTLKVKKI